MLTAIPRRPVRSTLWAAATALTLLAAPGHAQTDRAALAPANAAYAFRIPDTGRLWDAWKANAIYQSFIRLMEEPEFKSKTEGFAREVKTIEEALGFKLDGDTLSRIFSDAAFYMAPGENAGEVSAGFALGIADKDRLQKLIDLAEKAAISAVQDDLGTTDSASADEDTTGSSPISTEEYQGITLKRFSSDEDSGIYYAMTGDLLLGASSREEMTAVIDRMKGGPGSLAADANYKKVVAAAAPNGGEILFYTNAKSVLEMQQSQPGMDKLQELFRKITPVDYSGASIKIEPLRITGHGHGLLAESEMSEVLKKNPGKSPLAVANYASSNALLVAATSLLDARLYYDLLQQAVAAAGTDIASLEEQLKGIESMLGFAVKDDLIPALGNEFGLMINSFKFSGTTPVVEGVVVFKVGDRSRLKKVTDSIDKLAADKLAGASSKDDSDSKSDSGSKGLKTTKVGEATVKTLEIPGQAAYSPGYALDGDYFLIGTSVEALRNAIQTRQNPERGLAGSQILKKLAPEVSLTANSFQFFNFEGLWDTVKLLTVFAGDNAEQAGKVVDALRVFKVVGSSSSVQDSAVVSNFVLLLNEPGARSSSGDSDSQ